MNSGSHSQRAEEFFQRYQQEILRRTDRWFAGLMLFQWLAGIAITLSVSPRTWAGASSSVHPHVWAAIFLGGAISIFPILLAILRPGHVATRYTVAIAQMLFSALLIHLTGGRIETHFHVFGSLAFLAFYRDWRVLIPATIVVAVDHFARGIFWPYSVYGVLTASPWRSVEHAAWVIFEDVFLVMSCVRSVREMRLIAARQVELETTNEAIEEEVVRRTAEVRAGEEKLRLLIDGVKDYAIVTLDVTGRVSSWNSGAARIHGYEAQEIIGRDFSCFFSAPDLAAGRPAHDLQVAREQGRLEVETRRLRKDGSEFWADVIVTPLHSETGELRGFSEVTRDISDRRAAAEALKAFSEELELRVHERTAELANANGELQSEIAERKAAETAMLSAREEADRANRAKSEFLSRMSHELRTPLNAILGFTQILELDVVKPDQQASVAHILKGGNHLLGLINEVLDIARIESGRIELSLEAVPVREIIHESLALVQPLATQRNVHVRVAADISASACHVQADVQRLKQVVLNLLSNAIKYNRPGGTVSVTCREVEPKQLRIAVTDTGSGLSADKVQKLFIPFERLGAEDGAIEGTGLGLAISKRLIDVMGGKMGVESASGLGSKFWIELPIATHAIATATAVMDAGPALPQNPADDRAGAKKKQMLYIEDNLSNLQLIERILVLRPSIELIAAMQGSLGLDLAAQHRPDLILLDLNLPDISGHEVLIRLQADPRTAHIPVAIISADATPSQIARLWSAGVEEYLTKPLNVQKFLATIDRILSQTNNSKPSQAESESGLYSDDADESLLKKEASETAESDAVLQMRV